MTFRENMPLDDEESLISSAKEGDVHAFWQLIGDETESSSIFNRLRRRIYKVLWDYPDRAEDVFFDVLIEIQRKIANFQHQGSFYSFCYGFLYFRIGAEFKKLKIDRITLLDTPLNEQDNINDIFESLDEDSVVGNYASNGNPEDYLVLEEKLEIFIFELVKEFGSENSGKIFTMLSDGYLKKEISEAINMSNSTFSEKLSRVQNKSKEVTSK